MKRPLRFIIAALLLFCIIGIMVIIGRFGSSVVTLVKESNDPAIASKVINQLLVLQQPLPTGWRYFGGENVFPMKSASLINDRANTIVTISEIANPRHQTADKLDVSLAPIDKRGKFEFKGSGSTVVGGQKMYYRRGRLINTVEGDVPTQRGVLVRPDGNAIIIEIAEIGAKNFNIEIAQPLLDNIKGFTAKQ